MGNSLQFSLCTYQKGACWRVKLTHAETSSYKGLHDFFLTRRCDGKFRTWVFQCVSWKFTLCLGSLLSCIPSLDAGFRVHLVWCAHKYHGISDFILGITARHNEMVLDIPSGSIVHFIKDLFNFCNVFNILSVLNRIPHEDNSESRITVNFSLIFRILYSIAVMQQHQRNPHSRSWETELHYLL